MLNGGPTTRELTDRLNEGLPYNFYPRSVDLTKVDDRPPTESTVPVPELVERGLASAFKKHDFESLLDALEQLQTIAPPYGDAPVSDENRSTLTAFLDPKPEYKDLFDPIPVQLAHQDAIRLINVVVEECTADPAAREGGIDVRRLLKALAGRYVLTVVSLNYDTVADDSGVSWFDGYTRDVGGKFLTFEPEAWMTRDPDAHVLMHLHGSVRWGYHGDFRYPSPYEPVKFSTPALARESIDRGMSDTDAVYGHFYGSTPIISGLSKGGKMIYNVRPYGYYYQEAMSALTREPRLLVVGYGARDPHLTELIYEYVKVHDARRRPVAIVKIPGADVGERTPLRGMLERLAGRGNFNSDIAYDAFHKDREGAPRVQKHGLMLAVPSGLPCWTVTRSCFALFGSREWPTDVLPTRSFRRFSLR